MDRVYGVQPRTTEYMECSPEVPHFGAAVVGFADRSTMRHGH